MTDGLLVIDKPEGPTSHDVVARVRRILRERRIGHTGTLDPLATGVLPLVIGRATRLAQFLTAEDKRYRATIRLGQATTTYDREGDPMPPSGDPSAVTREQVEEILAGFRGPLEQIPPAYSAKKIQGETAHRLARRGETVTPAAVRVVVHELQLVSLEGALLTVDVHCSAGFYVRSLAHDVGLRLSCGAHLVALRRTGSGAITLADAVPLPEGDAPAESLRPHIRPLSALLPDWPAARTTVEGARKVGQGRMLGPEDCMDWPAMPSTVVDEGPPQVRILSPDGTLLALGGWRLQGRTAVLHPRIVLV
ncbi:MAG TPA: tRNA pseudouridine(55) synthase TruB [Vicinamibacterales bacterium]